MTLASPKGGQPPIDPKSDRPENQTPAQSRFKKDAEAQKAFANTVRLADVKAEDFDSVFYPGGHGPMWDLAKPELLGHGVHNEHCIGIGVVNEQRTNRTEEL